MAAVWQGWIVLFLEISIAPWQTVLVRLILLTLLEIPIQVHLFPWNFWILRPPTTTPYIPNKSIHGHLCKWTQTESVWEWKKYQQKLAFCCIIQSCCLFKIFVFLVWYVVIFIQDINRAWGNLEGAEKDFEDWLLKEMRRWDWILLIIKSVYLSTSVFATNKTNP